MRAKTVALIALLVCAGEAVYLLWPKASPPDRMVEKSVVVPEAVTPPVRDEPIMPEPAAEPPRSAPPEPEPVVAIDPQADPKTAIAEALRLFQEGDVATLIANFMPPSEAANMPEQAKAKIIEQMQVARTPGTPEYERMQLMIQGLASLQGTEPTYNDAGDRATYQLNVLAPDGTPARNPQPLTLIREDGRWYLK